MKEYTYLGFVSRLDDRGYCCIEQKNKFSVGDEIEVMKPDGRNLTVTVRAIYDADGNSMESAPHPRQELHLDLGMELDLYDILRCPC